jgi:prephenate dehydrogenase
MLQFKAYFSQKCSTLKKLVIFGVGLIGGSVALALKQAGLNTHIVGVGRTRESLDEALKLNIIDEAQSDVATALQGADVVLIAAPVAQTRQILSAIKPYLTSEMVITDAGSTKGDVIQAAQQVLDTQFSQFVGGHPIAGAEKSGAAAARADLYQDKNVIITPTDITSSHAAEVVRRLWQACGGLVSTMPPTQHDRIFAAVSHLPHLLAFALVDELASRPNAEQLFSFAASGFRDFSRIAGSHPEMWRDISLANKSALLSEISAYQAELATIKQLLESEDSQGLEAIFEKASRARNQWAKNKLQ